MKTGKTVAVVGSGPAGLAAAQQLARAGHDVTVFERADRIGGLLRYGIPDFKMEKWKLDRRLDQMKSEGVTFRPGVEHRQGRDRSATSSSPSFELRHLPVRRIDPGARPTDPRPGPEGNPPGDGFPPAAKLGASQATSGDGRPGLLHAKDKHVIIIDGGDTGPDCLSTSPSATNAKSVHQFEIVPRPPDDRAAFNPWPQWSNVFTASTAPRGGGRPRVLAQHRRFVGEGGRVVALEIIHVEMKSIKAGCNVRRDRRHREDLSGRPRPAGDGLHRP